MIQKPVLGEITQGTLFTCAIADRYADKRVHGLAITARCDIANNKYPVLNYLPVVTLLDWLHCDGIEILIENSRKNQSGSFDTILKQASIATSVLETIPRQTVVTSFFDDTNATKTRKKLAARAHELADQLDRLEALDLDCVKDRNWFLSAHQKEVSALIKELINNKVSSFYYLPSVTDENENEGYVVLLRESAFLPRRIAKEVANGLDRPVSSNSWLDSHLSFAHDDFAMPVGRIPSPNIEHILQTFSYMFGRIGLEDYSSDFVSDVCARNFLKEETA
ncbi:hypothetical protein [Roseibium litorale]|uniref:Cyclodipeptide synthase n=1 Tax=Roseibium litorale TaxID=2803841 RepID=A0ABR9CSD6_9HYPH|nr:hypothetical protein [Roseibium litorale]MBD8893514.1 hypothetical protein [Roseibium litorale]